LCRNARKRIQPELRYRKKQKRKTHLHDRLAPSLQQHHTPVVLERHPPDRLAWLRQLPHERPTPQIPKLQPPVIPAADDEAIVELEAGDRVVVREEVEEAFVGGEVEDDDSAVGAASDEDGVGELKLPNESGMASEGGEVVGVVR
jgi:hypothetical protein